MNENEPLSHLELFQELETGFAERAGEIFRTVINLETTLSLAELLRADAEALQALGEDELVLVEVPAVKGLDGRICFLLEKALTAKVVDFMIMGDGEVEFMPEEHLDGIVEAVNQLISAEFNQLSERLGVGLRCEVQPARLIPAEELRGAFEGWILARFELQIEGQPAFPLVKLYQPELYDRLGEMLGGGAPVAEDETGGDAAADAEAEGEASPQGAESEEGADAGPATGPAEEGTEAKEVRKAQFTDFGPSAARREASLEDVSASLGRLMDLELPVVIELGRTKMLVKDVVELAPGSVVELNKLVGEPVDLFVNGKRFAQGEVVVIDENFGVRITELVSVEERRKEINQA